MQKLSSSSLVFASSSRHKLEEYRAVLSLPYLRPRIKNVVDPQDLSLEVLVTKKIEVIRQLIPDAPFFVDHTGLVIDAWKRLPGGLTRMFINAVGPAGLCKMLHGVPEEQRIARATTVIGYYYDRQLLTFVGTALGRIAVEPRAAPGFSWDWDSIFIPDRHDRTYAEMSFSEKNAISMRKEAADRFRVGCLEVYFDHHVPTTPPPVAPAKAGAEDGSQKVKILLLAANPLDTPPLEIDRETEAVVDALQRAEHGRQFKVEQYHSVYYTDLQSILMRERPHIVHFSGHGSESGEIIMQDESGMSHPISSSSLGRLFSLLKDNIRCVVLNACYTEKQAKEIVKHIDCVVGMSRAIQDETSIRFAKAFYEALGFGKDVRTSFDLACLQIDFSGLGEEDSPKLLASAVDPRSVVFTR